MEALHSQILNTFPAVDEAAVDALLATVQMPSGIPVATVAIDGATNAALLAAQILALQDEELTAKLKALREEGRQKVLQKDKALDI